MASGLSRTSCALVRLIERNLDYNFGDCPQCHQHAGVALLVPTGPHADSMLGHIQ